VLHLAEIGYFEIMSCFVKEGDKSNLRNFYLKETIEHANNVYQAIGNV
jgi:hypothetical protein